MTEEPDELAEVRQRIGRNMARLRRRRRLTQIAAADLAGINRKHFSAIEGGSENPTIETLVRIASALRVDVGELLGR